MTVTSLAGPDGSAELQLFLEVAQDRDVFQRLCEDLLSHSAQAASAAAATDELIERLRRWQALLSVSRGSELPEHEVRGLFGELYVLLELLVPAWGVQASIEAWIAPDRHPQDFSLPATLVEIKTRLQNAEAAVNISSLEQLDDCGRSLHLVIVGITADASEASSQTVNDQAALLIALAESVDVELGDIARNKLRKRGYAPSPRYDSWRYSVCGVQGYHVSAGFPRLMRSEVDSRISNATYALSTAGLQDFEVDCALIFKPHC